MTRPGYESLQDELRRLKFEERPHVVEEIKAARDHGDLSENAEYDAAKERQAHVEGRIAQIEDRLARAEIVDPGEVETDRVRFGTTVLLRDVDSGEERKYTLVGEEEADVNKSMISVTSPVGRALIGKAVDDEVVVSVPAGTRTYEVLEIRPME